jgi:uncharacterized protein
MGVQICILMQRRTCTETRLKAIGRTETGRHVLIVFALRQRNGERLIRLISARYMHAKEIKYYEQEAAKIAQR